MGARRAKRAMLGPATNLQSCTVHRNAGNAPVLKDLVPVPDIVLHEGDWTALYTLLFLHL